MTAQHQGDAPGSVPPWPQLVVGLTASRSDRADQPGSHLSSWQVLTGASVTACTWAGGEMAVSTFPVGRWRELLTQVATTPISPPTAARRPHRVPYQVLLATGAAMLARRPDLVSVLLATAKPAAGATRHSLADRPGPADLPRLTELHTRALGRLTVLVASPASRRCALLSWLLLPDGWWALRPCGGPAARAVELTPTRAELLPGEVARLAAVVA